MNTPTPITRRGFIRTAALSTAATAMTAKSYSQITGANDRVRVGLIGFGLIGRFHMAAIQEHPDARITAVCDVHRGRKWRAAIRRATAISENCSRTKMWMPSMSPHRTIGTR